jgi:hypothetical protein
MKIDMEKLKALTASVKKQNVLNTLPTHEVWIPAPEKETAKTHVLKWNPTLKRHEFASANPETHFCAKFLTSNYVKLTGKIPYDFKDQFIELGVVNKPVDGEWGFYVLQHEDYAELIASLMELELL